MDTVRVSSGNFKSIMFMRSAERKVYTEQRIPENQKQQKTTVDGVPVWSVTVAAVDFRDQPQMITATVASYDDPAQVFHPGEPVEFVALTFGVTPKRNGGGYTTWCSAEQINPAGAGTVANLKAS